MIREEFETLKKVVYASEVPLKTALKAGGVAYSTGEIYKSVDPTTCCPCKRSLEVI